MELPKILNIMHDCYEGNTEKYGVVCLNQELSSKCLHAIKNAEYVVFADGGSNRFLDLLENKGQIVQDEIKKMQSYKNNKIYVAGDLDSLNETTKKTFDALKIPIIRVDDQDTTDFQKALDLLEGLYTKDACPNAKKLLVLVFGSLNGRFDHTTSAIHTLYKQRDMKLSLNLVCEKTLLCLIPSGESRINLNHPEILPICGILPFMPVKSIQTTGLQWNIDNKPMSMEGLCSTSNQWKDTTVTIKSSDPVVWFSQISTL